jgi:putative amidoligase enzyme
MALKVNPRRTDGLCFRCLRSPVSPMYPKTLVCARCALCNQCGAAPSVDDETLRCINCRCSRCQSVKSLRYENGKKRNADGIIPMICFPCWMKENPGKICKFCKERESSVYARERGHKKPEAPSACSYCINNAQYELICFWCTSPLKEQGFTRFFPKSKTESTLECTVCNGSPACFKGKCLPTRPCQNCLDKSAGAHLTLGEMYFVQPVRFWDAEGLADRKKNHSSRHLSAEIEVAGLRNNGTKHIPEGPCSCPACYASRRMAISEFVRSIGGSVVQDESLPQGGFEINMPPAAGDHFLRLVDQTSNTLRDSFAFVTDKCGTHLHIDARDYTHTDLRRLLILYSKIEPALIYTQDAARVLKEKSHCFPCGKKYAVPELIDVKRMEPRYYQLGDDARNYSKALRHTLTEVVYDKKVERPPLYSRGNNRSIKARYDALNVHSWYFRRTIECRLHAGTISARKIQTWGIMWANILDKALAMTDKEVIALPADDPKGLLLSIIPSQCHDYLRNRWNKFEPTYKGRKF